MATRRGFLGFLAAGALGAVLSAALSACGRKGSPQFPEGSQYPKTYPRDSEAKP